MFECTEENISTTIRIRFTFDGKIESMWCNVKCVDSLETSFSKAMKWKRTLGIKPRQ